MDSIGVELFKGLMTDIATQFLIAPIKGEKAFQAFCLELARLEWNDSDAEIHGRQGQAQNGVDITGTDRTRGRGRAGMQCKGSESNVPRALTVEEFEAEVEKTKTLRPKLGLYIVAFTGPRDAVLSNRAAEYREQHQAEGLFEVYAWSWDEILDRSTKHPALVERLERMVRPTKDTQHTLVLKRPGDGAPMELVKDQIKALAEAVRYIDELPKADAADAAYNAKIDVFRDLVRGGDAEAAQGQLLTFISGLSDTASDRVWFRAYANLGAAYIGTSSLDLAADAFDKAAVREGETADGLSYRARAAQARGENERCYGLAKAALGLDPANILAGNLLIETAPDEIKTSDLEAQLSAISNNGDVGWALSRRYSGEGRSDEALRCATDLIDDPAWIKPIAIGDAILNRFDDDIEVRIGVPMTEERCALADRAVAAYEKAWAIIKARRDKTLWVHAVLNLNACYRLVGRDKEADELALEAYRWAPEVEQVQMRAALAHLHANQYAAAQVIGEKLAETKPETAFFAAHLCAAAKDYPRTLFWAKKAMEANEGRDKVRAAELYVLGLEHTTSAAEALVQALGLEKDLDFAPSYLARLADLARAAGDDAVLMRVRADLDGFDVAALDPVERFELSEAFADDEQWSKAADAIEGLYGRDRPSVLLNRRLYALLKADRRQDARTLFETLGPEVRASRSVCRLGASIYERSGLIKDAIAQLNAALKTGAEDLRTRLDWVRLNLRDGQEDVVRKWVRRADPNPSGDIEDLLEFAQVLSKFGRRHDALSLGYRSLRQAWGTSEAAHVRYSSLFVLQGRTKEAWLKPKVVEVDTEVKLKREHGAESVYRIEAGPPAPGRIAPDHPFARALMGKKAGDKVTLPEGLGDPVEWTVDEIKHVYLALFHEVLKEHGVLFPDNSSFGMFTVDLAAANPFQPLLDRLRDRARTGHEVLDMYKTEGVPVDFVAEVMGADVMDAADALRWTSDITLDTCRGNNEERLEALAGLEGVQAVLVDDLTLGLWDEVGLIETLRDRGIKIQVVQATIDRNTARIEKAQLEVGQRGGVMAAVGDRFQYTEIPAELRQARVKTLQERLERIRALVEIVPTETWKPGTFPDGLEDTLTHSSKDTISTAIATGVPLVCDDRRLRLLAGELGLQTSAWTQPLLITLVNSGTLGKRDYAYILGKLATRRIGFVSIDAFDLVATVVAGDMPTLDALLKCLTAPTIDPVSLIHVADVFISALWLRPGVKDRREFFTSRLLEQILTNRSADYADLIEKIYAQVRGGLQRQKFPGNLIATDFHNYVLAFAKGHFLAAG